MLYTKSDLIDGDGFEQLAHKLGLVYIKTHDLNIQINIVRTQPRVTSILSHNSDGCILPVGSTRLREYDFAWDNIPGNINHWFAQNADVVDARLTYLPIGLERDRWYPDYHKKDTILSLPEADSKGLLYLNVNTAIRVQREILYQLLDGVSWCTAERGWNGVDFEHYARQIKAHKFTLSPDGNGFDTYRTWEALYLGSFPIVEQHCFTKEFAEHLPLLIVDDWSQLTEGYLNAKYDEFMNREWNWDMLKLSYWEDLIRGMK